MIQNPAETNNNGELVSTTATTTDGSARLEAAGVLMLRSVAADKP